MTNKYIESFIEDLKFFGLSEDKYKYETCICYQLRTKTELLEIVIYPDITEVNLSIYRDSKPKSDITKNYILDNKCNYSILLNLLMGAFHEMCMASHELRPKEEVISMQERINDLYEQVMEEANKLEDFMNNNPDILVYSSMYATKVTSIEVHSVIGGYDLGLDLPFEQVLDGIEPTDAYNDFFRTVICSKEEATECSESSVETLELILKFFKQLEYFAPMRP